MDLFRGSPAANSVPETAKMTKAYRKDRRSIDRISFLFFLLAFVFGRANVEGFDRNNLPLKTWGGFSVHRSWIYDALEKVALAGLTEEVLLNSKPLNRREAAKIVAQAVRRLQTDEYGDYNHRGYLEDLLYELIQEFRFELGELGIKTPLNREAPKTFFNLTSVDHLQFGGDFAARSQEIPNRFGQRIHKGGNGNPTLDGRLQIGDFLSFYYQPELIGNRESSQGRILNSYGKLTFWNTELELGRDSLWWGPGYRGSMSFSNNALPLDQIRIGSAEPFHLPWLLSYLGPVKANLFVARLEKDREIAHAKVSGWRIGVAPSRFVELGFNRMFQFGGRGRQALNPGQFLGLLVTQGSDDANKSTNVNNVMSFDGTFRIPDIERYIMIARDAAFYFDFGWDDTLFGLIVPDKPGGLLGTYLAGVFGDPKLDLRIEYAKTSDLQFTHAGYTSGFTYKGSVLSHFVGTKGDDLYARATRWINPDLLVGFQISRSRIGSTLPSHLGPSLVESASFGLDAAYRISPNSSISLGYHYARLQGQDRNTGADTGSTKNNNVFRFEFTRSFGQ